jgi:hypothetical protein
MSAKPSPSNLPGPSQPARSNSRAARTGIRFVCACRLIHSQRARRTLCFASASRTSLLQTRTYDGDRACHAPRVPAGLRNSRFRFEVPARIARPGGKCRRPRCDQFPGCAPKSAAQPAAHLRFHLNPSRNQALDSFLRISQFVCTSKLIQARTGAQITIVPFCLSSPVCFVFSGTISPPSSAPTSGHPTKGRRGSSDWSSSSVKVLSPGSPTPPRTLLCWGTSARIHAPHVNVPNAGASIFSASLCRFFNLSSL